MYILDQAKKEDPVRRWDLPDRIFFGHGACHILAGAFLERFAQSAFQPYWIKPLGELPGMHVFVSDGEVTFDYHGYALLVRLEIHHQKVWSSQYPGWQGELLPVNFPLLDSDALNQRNMRGPDQFLGDALARAQRFIDRIDHPAGSLKARSLPQPR